MMRIGQTAIVSFLLLWPGAVRGATWFVVPASGSNSVSGAPDDPFSTIQAAIDAASDGDEVLVPGGIHRGPGNRDLNFQGKNIRLTCATWPDQLIPCVLDAEGAARVFVFESGETQDAVVEGMVIVRGAAPRGSDFTNVGGCVVIRESSPTFVDCAFASCAADVGGAVAAFGGAPAFRRCAFAANRSASSGGAGYFRSTRVTIRSSDFDLNWAIDATVMGVGGRVTIRDCSFASNTALGSAGVRQAGGRLRLINCEFLSNFGSLEAVQNGATDALIVNSLFARNTGGGLRDTGGGSRIVGCTVAGNQGPGIVVDAANVEVANTIVWNNGGEEIVGDAAMVTFSLVEGGMPGPGNLDLDPLFAAPRLGNFQLESGSPAIDAGDNGAVPLAGRLRDLSGRRRFRDDPHTADTGSGDPPIVDMGAFEFAPRRLPRESPGRLRVVGSGRHVSGE